MPRRQGNVRDDEKGVSLLLLVNFGSVPNISMAPY
jgi:hypothetical protein